MIGIVKRRIYYSAMTDALFVDDPLNDPSIRSLNLLGVTSRDALDHWIYRRHRVKDAYTCNKKLKWLLYEGHRLEYNSLKNCLSAMPATERSKYIASLPDSSEHKSKLMRVDKIMPFLGSGGIAAYDYALYLALAQTGVRLGYITIREARVFSHEIARIAQRQYVSWDEYNVGCIAGMYYSAPPEGGEVMPYSTYNQYMITRLLARRFSAKKLIGWQTRL
ncbi:DUF1266 domain-containing protein [Paenibacillus lentus]|uniref:DUF1266 domain-containing protein n=1 Tax=Paenibacillus lentus TaxID=1338368 RepID=A0A3S8RYN6_9BACL|nr:DUF1266 domain-containing protein [Paenibacillus lentus]AZK48046.1 DUF1266 domain-containing protein [Paenibacillus lentus]